MTAYDRSLAPVKNPMAAVNMDIFEQVRKAKLGKPSGKIAAELHDIREDIRRAMHHTGQGEEMDLMKASSDILPGTTEVEKAIKLVEMNSHLAGCRQAHTDRVELENLMTRIDDPAAEAAAPVPVFDVSNQGRSFRQIFMDYARNNPRIMQMDVPGSHWIEVPGTDREIYNTLFERTAGWPPFVPRDPGVTLSPQRPPQVMEVFPMRQTFATSAIKYMRETKYTSKAAERSEGKAYAEATLQVSEETVPIQSIGVSLPATDEQIADVAEAAGYIESRLMFMVTTHFDNQIFNGSGTSPELNGLLADSDINTVNPTITAGAIVKPWNMLDSAIVKTFNASYMFPDTIFLHPSIWSEIVQSETTAGGYYVGSPQSGVVPMAWGLRVIRTHTLSSDTSTSAEVIGVIATTSPVAGEIRMRAGVEIRTGWVDTDFTDGKMRWRCGMRAALAWYLPEAFTQIKIA